MPRQLDRAMRILYLDGMVGAAEVTLGELVDEIKASIMADLQAAFTAEQKALFGTSSALTETAP